MKIIYEPTYDCEDRETIEKVLQICKQNAIKTFGALATPKITVKEYEDGDQGVIVEIESASVNRTWYMSAHKLVNKIINEFYNSSLALGKGKYIINICTHVCDPD